jgi:hypothetical protein
VSAEESGQPTVEPAAERLVRTCAKEQTSASSSGILNEVGMHLTQVGPTSSMRQWWKKNIRAI